MTKAPVAYAPKTATDKMPFPGHRTCAQWTDTDAEARALFNQHYRRNRTEARSMAAGE